MLEQVSGVGIIKTFRDKIVPKKSHMLFKCNSYFIFYEVKWFVCTNVRVLVCLFVLKVGEKMRGKETRKIKKIWIKLSFFVVYYIVCFFNTLSSDSSVWKLVVPNIYY